MLSSAEKPRIHVLHILDYQFASSGFVASILAMHIYEGNDEEEERLGRNLMSYCHLQFCPYFVVIFNICPQGKWLLHDA